MAGQAPWSYEEALAWLYGRQALGIKLGLGKVHRLLAMVHDPHDAFASIHVAGTNGKGSVTRMLAEVLRRSGQRVGLTTSPHLIRFTERIEVDGKPIEEADVARLLAQLRPAAETLDREGTPPTFFELVTALAFCAFRDAGVAWAVVETGLGGRLDATNVLDPRLTIITNVDLDHTAMLGPTIPEIAFEKAGIMKPGVPCITAAKGDALQVILVRSHQEMAPMSVIGGDYHVHDDGTGDLVLVRPNGEARYHVGLDGAHQRTNAALVVAAVDALRTQGLVVPERALRDGLAHATNPGRLESFTYRGTQVLIDGAHNIAAAHALRSHLGRLGWFGFDLVVGFCKDKDWQDCLDQWAPLAGRVWGVPVRNPRSLDPAAILDAVAPIGNGAGALPEARAALDAAVAKGAERIVVAGSLFLAGEARAVLTGASLEEIRGTQ